jgi:hypothetical protein
MVQSQEKEKQLRESCRLLGRILLEDYGVFENRVELLRYLKEFILYKADMEMAHLQMKDLKKDN